MHMSVEALDELVLLINSGALEKDRRILLAAAAKVYGHGGEKRVKDLTGMAFSTLHRGKNDAEKEIKRYISRETTAETPPMSTDEAASPSGNEKKTTRHTGSNPLLQKEC